MSKSESNALPLLAVFIAGPLAARFSPLEPWTALLTGAALLIILLAFDRDLQRTTWQSVAFGAACGFCVMIGSPGILQYLGVMPRGQISGVPPANGIVFQPQPFAWLPVIWIAASILFCIIDRSRMSASAPAATGYFAPPVYQQPRAQPYVYQPSQPPPAPVYQPPPSVSTPLPPPPPAAPAPPPSMFAAPPAAAPSVFAQPEPEPPPPPPPAPAAPPANAVPIATGVGKPAVIYLNLVGEGLAVMRSVQAEHVGKDYYLITEPMPPGETWQFQPGQIVRCQKKNLSSGKALVAVEEAPRAS